MTDIDEQTRKANLYSLCFVLVGIGVAILTFVQVNVPSSTMIGQANVLFVAHLHYQLKYTCSSSNDANLRCTQHSAANDFLASW